MKQSSKINSIYHPLNGHSESRPIVHAHTHTTRRAADMSCLKNGTNSVNFTR